MRKESVSKTLLALRRQRKKTVGKYLDGGWLPTCIKRKAVSVIGINDEATVVCTTCKGTGLDRIPGQRWWQLATYRHCLICNGKGCWPKVKRYYNVTTYTPDFKPGCGVWTT